MKQPRNLTLEVIRESLPSIHRHKKVPRFPISEGWRKIRDDPCLSDSRHKLVVPILLGLLQTVQVNELVQPDCVSLSDNHPYLHTTNHYPPRVWYKLPRSNIEVVQEFHDEWVDGELKATLKNSLVEAYFPRWEMTCFFPFLRKTNPNFLRELELVPILKDGVSI